MNLLASHEFEIECSSKGISINIVLSMLVTETWSFFCSHRFLSRSPSPEPIYNNEGKRMNTREYRTRRALEDERHEKIQKLMLLNANYKAPADYK